MFPADDPDLSALVAERYEHEQRAEESRGAAGRLGEAIATLVLLVGAVALVCLLLGGVWLLALLLAGIARAV